MKNKALYRDIPEYNYYYFDLIETDDLMAEFEKSTALTLSTFKLVTPDIEHYAYQPNKWTINEVLRHIIDMERIFAYRAFRMSRFDETSLSGVEENDYIDNVKQLDFNLSDLLEEYMTVRKATVLIYKNITEEMLDFKGTANKQTYTARTLGFATIGHNIHHCNFIKKTYLKYQQKRLNS